MGECKFCAGGRVNAEYVGEGIRTMRINLSMMFGAFNDDDEKDGIRLVDGKYLAFDNSSGEYAEQMVEINYCPLCGKKIEPKEGIA
jgi:hypothetical protein